MSACVFQVNKVVGCALTATNVHKPLKKRWRPMKCNNPDGHSGQRCSKILNLCWSHVFVSLWGNWNEFKGCRDVTPTPTPHTFFSFFLLKCWSCTLFFFPGELLTYSEIFLNKRKLVSTAHWATSLNNFFCFRHHYYFYYNHCNFAVPQ